jgi:ABC-2 type transport system ATP-binding protein
VHDGSGRITVQQLTKQFGPVTAVQNLSFTVEPGSVTGFLGPNGAGKTTTLRMVLGLVAPTGGTATVNGQPFTGLGNPARVVGAVLEAQGFHPKRTARNHLRVYAAAIGVPDSRADQVLQLVGLGAAGGRNAGAFSLGMKQRLALATALLGDPQILVLDEPANGLDPEGIAWLRTFLKSFAASGRTVLISSHALAEVEQTVDQVVIISRGQTMYNGPLEHLRRSQQARVLVQPSDPTALVTALRDDEIYNIETMPDGRLAVGGVDPKRVADVAMKAGVSVYGIEEERVNLEQLYFALTQGQYTAGTPFGGPPPGQGGWGGPPTGGQPQGYQPQQGYQPPAQQPSQYQDQQQFQTGAQPPVNGFGQPQAPQAPQTPQQGYQQPQQQFGQPAQFGQPSQFGQPAQPDPSQQFGQPQGYQATPYQSQPFPQAYGQPEQGQPGPFGQPQQYEQPQQYGQPQQFGTAQPFGAQADVTQQYGQQQQYGQPQQADQAQQYGQQPSGQPQQPLQQGPPTGGTPSGGLPVQDAPPAGAPPFGGQPADAPPSDAHPGSAQSGDAQPGSAQPHGAAPQDTPPQGGEQHDAPHDGDSQHNQGESGGNH